MKYIKDFEINKRIPNIVIGLIFGLLAMKTFPSIYSYIFYIISCIFFVFTDRIIKIFFVSLDEKVEIKENVNVKKDKDGTTTKSR